MKLNDLTRLQELTVLYKGVDPLLLQNLSISNQNNLINTTLKEMMILAETGKPSASKTLYDLINKSSKSFTKDELIRINSLIEFGTEFESLSKSLQKEIKKSEIKEEMNHFSRIMGLDKIISGANLLPLSTSDAIAQCKDFARFIWLLLERRNEKISSDYKLKYFPGKVEIKQNGNTFLICQNKENNFTVLLYLKSNTTKLANSLFGEIANVMSKFLSTYSLEIAIALLEYFLFLTQFSIDIDLAGVQETSSSNGKSTIKLYATSGLCLVLEKNLNNFSNKLTKKCSFQSLKRSSFGKLYPSLINQRTLIVSDRASQVFIFPSTTPLTQLSRNKLLKLINSKDRKGKIIPFNNIANIIRVESDNLFGLLKPGNKNINPNLESNFLETDLSKHLINAKRIVVEAAHLHADRNPSQTQFDTIALKNILVKKLISSGFDGKIENVLMIDDYHVVNRLDYNNYLERLKVVKFIPDFIILESSPIIREIAVEILKRLEAIVPEKLEIKGGNFYLTLSSSKVIELVEGYGGKNVIGCVLFDAAFSLFKRNIKKVNSVFKKLNSMNFKKLDSEILNYYMKEKNPINRRSFVLSLHSSIPNLESLSKYSKKTPLLDELASENSVEILNIHEIFYQPQQAKVNALLALINKNPISTAYLNPQANDVLIECSALFG